MLTLYRLTPYLLLSLLLGCDKPAEPPPPPKPALVQVVGAPATKATLALVGEVRPRYESRQAFRIAGKIVQRMLEVGAVVKRGQVLAQLDAADTQLQSAAALANVQAAEADYALAQAELQRQQQLFSKQFIAAAALDQYQAKFKTASARLKQVKAQAKVATNQTQYNQLVADRDGIITAIHAEPGQVVAAGETIAQIADTQAVDILVAVPEARMKEVNAHEQVTIKLWADHQKVYRGQVREIAPSADQATRTFTVKISVHNPDAALKLGMTTGVSFPGAETNQGLLIPSTALTAIDGQPTVWVIDQQHTAQPRQVVTGPFSEAGIAVLKGLQAGETIAIAGIHTLIKGQQIRPIMDKQP